MAEAGTLFSEWASNFALSRYTSIVRINNDIESDGPTYEFSTFTDKERETIVRYLKLSIQEQHRSGESAAYPIVTATGVSQTTNREDIPKCVPYVIVNISSVFLPLDLQRTGSINNGTQTTFEPKKSPHVPPYGKNGIYYYEQLLYNATDDERNTLTTVMNYHAL